MNRDWSSTESSGYGTEDGQRRGPRGFITKSNSYGGNPAIHLDPLNLRTRSLSKAGNLHVAKKKTYLDALLNTDF